MAFDGKTVIITGGASGIGLACASAFAESSAKGIIIADVDTEKGVYESETIRKKTGRDVKFVFTDVSDENSVQEMADFAISSWGQVDIMINNAAICPITSWDDITRESWDRIIAINLTGMFLCTKAVAVHMRRQKSGRIVFISSTGALVGSHVAHPAYGASKAGVISLMKSVAKEFARDGILATAILPGPIETGISKSFPEEIRAKLANGTLLKRYGKPHEIADAVLFLCGEGGSFITGTTLQVSGGEILY